ncbi:hypothetical protein FTX61_03840 [Nitriliruptoraceae bacterium ZYF776]|nr:hypothetical protein [Profundirhabdus halotolerans]
MKLCFMFLLVVNERADVSADATATAAPIVLTAAGRTWLGERLARAEERLTRIDEELRSDRDEGLVREQLQLRAQVDELADVLTRAVAPGEVSDDPSVIEVGDEVEVRFPDDSLETFLVVHPIEAGLDEQRTSVDSPLARAVLGHRRGDRVTVTSPAGVYHATIVGRRRIG